MSEYLLDTQIVLWSGGDVDRLHPSVVELLSETSNTMLVSSVSVAEMVIKQSTGKLSLPMAAIALTEQLGFEIVNLTGLEAQKMSELPLLHRDPFDRLLIAQAIDRHVPLITADRQIWRYDVVQIIRNP